jgi:hypothetical protein
MAIWAHTHLCGSIPLTTTELRKLAATWLATGRSSVLARVSQPDQLAQTLRTHQPAQLVIRAVSIFCIPQKMASLWQMLLGKLHGLHPCRSAAIRDGLVRSREVSSARRSIQGLLCGSGFDLRFNSRSFGKMGQLENISLGLVYNGFSTQTHLSLLLKNSFPEYGYKRSVPLPIPVTSLFRSRSIPKTWVYA